MFIHLMRFCCPLAYLVLAGTAWSLCFRRKFSSSLAPALMVHILIVLLSGLVFKRLSPGIYGGIGAMFACLGYTALRGKGRFTKARLRGIARELWDGGLLLFVVFYVLCYFLNRNKRFRVWDEFSHWGMFLKECLRLDALYCMSPLEFMHKDYVPAVTLFETVWCRLSFRYSEPDAYRAIQVFMFSLLMPMFEPFDARPDGAGKGDPGHAARIRRWIPRFVSVCLVLLIPLIFNTFNGFYFYHSIYCDIAVGILFFYCLLEAYRDREGTGYQTAVLTIGLAVLVLSKMTAAAMLPMVLALYALLIPFLQGKSRKRAWIRMIPMTLLPAALWIWFNRFAARYAPSTDIQSYGGMQLSSVKEVFFSRESSAIPYLGTLRSAFVHALFHQDVLIRGSYVAALLAIVALFLILAHFAPDRQSGRRIRVAGFWTLGAGIAHALLMYFLYATAFSEYEAGILASYERYMNSFVIAAMLLLVAVYYDSRIWKKSMGVLCAAPVLIALYLAIFHIHAYDQLLPGDLGHDAERLYYYTDRSGLILQKTSEEDRIYIVKRADNGDFLWRERYFCAPRKLGGGSIGPAAFEGDIWSIDLTVEELVREMGEYDYVMFDTLDDAFIGKYAGAFEDPGKLADDTFYRITCADSVIRLE